MRRVDVSNAAGFGGVTLRRQIHHEAWQPWYGSSMNALRQSEANGGPARNGARLAAEYDDGLYRYVPVPPVFRDAEGYPVEDGMSQNEGHQNETAYWCGVLQRRFPEATVCSDLPVHYREGDGNRAVVPDLLVALRAPPLGNRPSYKLWENPVPDLAMEMLSPGNWREDDGPKRRTYEHIGVRECWLFDQGGRYLSAQLVGYRLHGGDYRRIAANAAGRLPSEVLGLELHVRDGRLRFRDPATGKDLQTAAEEAEGRANAEAGRAAAERRADTAEAGKASAERRADAAEAGKAAAERRADAAERELARLRQLQKS